MQLHNLKSHSGRRKKQRVGRGGKRGTTSGRGTKGQRARAGARIRPAERDILKTIPKLRGYKFKSFRAYPVAVPFAAIERSFEEGETISPETLSRRGVIRKTSGRIPRVKVIGRTAASKKFIFKDVVFSRPFGDTAATS